MIHFLEYNIVLLDQRIGPHQVLPLWVWVDMGAIAMEGYFTFLKFLSL